MTILIGLGMLSACSDSDDRKLVAQNDNAADMSLSLNSGHAGLASDANGSHLAVSLPWMKGDITLPKIEFGGGDVDIDGVPLYPGSRVTGIEVSGQEGSRQGAVVIHFRSKAAPERVQSYFLDAFTDKGVSAMAKGSGVAGRNHAGEPFLIDLDRDGDPQNEIEGTRGVLHLGGAQG